MESNEQAVPARADSNNKTIAKFIEEIIFLLKEGKHEEALSHNEEAVAQFGREPILVRAEAEITLARSIAEQDVQLKRDYLDEAMVAAASAIDLLPGAVEFAYFLAKLLASNKLYKRAVAECEKVLTVTDCVDPYCNISLDWEGKQMESTSEARIGKIMQGITRLMKKCKVDFLHDFFLSTKVSAGVKIRLEPLMNPLQSLPSPIPDCIFWYWASLHILDRLEYKAFRVFDIFAEFNDGSHWSHVLLLLDLIYKYCLCGKWDVCLCGFCRRTFSNSEGYKEHIINDHFCAINEYCHDNLPIWAQKSMEKIWGMNRLVGDEWDNIDIKGAKGFLSDIFELSVEDDSFLEWLYGGSSSAEGIINWEKKIVELEKCSEGLMKKIGEKVKDVKEACNLLLPDQKEVHISELKLERILMEALVDIRDHLEQMNSYCHVDSQLFVEPFIKYFLKIRLEVAKYASEADTDASSRPSKDQVYLDAVIGKRIRLFEAIRMEQVIERGKFEVKEAKRWITSPMDLVLEKSNSLPSNAIIAQVNGTLWDMSRPLEGDCELRCFTFEDNEGRSTFWYSSAHILGQSLEMEYGCQLCSGSCTTNGKGFYYDAFYNDLTLSVDHLKCIQAQAETIVSEKQRFERIVVCRKQALEIFADNHFKVELINALPEDELITVYRCGLLVDLCQGPHIPDTAFVRAFACLKKSGCYWRGDGDHERLQRVYGISFPDAKSLEEFMEEAEL